MLTTLAKVFAVDNELSSPSATYTARGAFIQYDTEVRWSAFEPLLFVLRVEEVRAVEDAFEGFGDMVFGGYSIEGYIVERKLHKVLVFTPR